MDILHMLCLAVFASSRFIWCCAIKKVASRGAKLFQCCVNRLHPGRQNQRIKLFHSITRNRTFESLDWSDGRVRLRPPNQTMCAALCLEKLLRRMAHPLMAHDEPLKVTIRCQPWNPTPEFWLQKLPKKLHHVSILRGQQNSLLYEELFITSVKLSLHLRLRDLVFSLQGGHQNTGGCHKPPMTLQL